MTTLDDIVVDPPAEGEVVDPRTWFAGLAPGLLEVEIGSGKGGLLLARARANPTVRLLGIEWASKYYRSCADRMARWGLRNVRVMRTDAKHFFLHHLAGACVSVLHVYHPDPWPKARHHKRRLIDAAFVSAVERVLQPGGRWFIQTDHAEYFEIIKESVAAADRLVEIPWDDSLVADNPDWEGTNFEVKYVREGRAIYRVACALPGGTA